MELSEQSLRALEVGPDSAQGFSTDDNRAIVETLGNSFDIFGVFQQLATLSSYLPWRVLYLPPEAVCHLTGGRYSDEAGGEAQGLHRWSGPWPRLHQRHLLEALHVVRIKGAVWAIKMAET